MKIKEVIVVEGKKDTAAVQKAVDADTIETNGSAVTERTLASIRLARQRRGVIVLTDPDVPGRHIRHLIMQHVPGCKHAFIPREKARGEKASSLGVEHACPQVIREALQAVRTDMPSEHEKITKNDLVRAGLIGGNEAKRRRQRLGEALHIGYTNGKQLYKRLKMFQISKEDFLRACQLMEREDCK
ncbi:MAG TPA: ribonuclease M5 [Bacillales bacterium]|nr:ribonuclease M5 [Bacillales bacterium]